MVTTYSGEGAINEGHTQLFEAVLLKQVSLSSLFDATTQVLSGESVAERVPRQTLSSNWAAFTVPHAA